MLKIEFDSFFAYRTNNNNNNNNNNDDDDDDDDKQLQSLREKKGAACSLAQLGLLTHRKRRIAPQGCPRWFV